MSYNFYGVPYAARQLCYTVAVTSNWISAPLFIHQTKFRAALLSRSPAVRAVTVSLILLAGQFVGEVTEAKVRSIRLANFRRYAAVPIRSSRSQSTARPIVFDALHVRHRADFPELSRSSIEV